jgi:hypothetical protein
MSEEQQRFKRQADWQKSLRTLPWPEKIRMVEKVRESVKQLRNTPPSKENRAIHPQAPSNNSPSSSS